MSDYSDTRIQFRRGTANEWSASNAILGAGEPGYDTENGILKVGTGGIAWDDLAAIINSNVKPVENNYNGSGVSVVSGIFNAVFCNQDTYDNQSSYDPNTLYFVQQQE